MRLASCASPIVFVVVLAACGGVATPGADLGDDGGPAIEALDRGWIGGGCTSAGDCAYAEATCLPSSSGFPGGLCTQRCEHTCPDRQGPDDTETFCVADRDGAGTCVARCDFERAPATGCRAGYGCVATSRMGEPDRIVETCMPLGADGTARPLNDLQPMLERAAAACDLGAQRIVLVDVTQGRAPLTAALRPDDPVYPASVIKTPIMVEVQHQIELGTLRGDEVLTVSAEEDTCEGLPSGDTRPTLEAGDTATVDQLVEVMITRSDNTATNVLIDRVGRTAVTAYMGALGLPSLQLYRHVFGCEPYTDSGWDGVHMNTMTARATAALYALILDGGPGFLGEASRLRMQAVLADQRWKGGVAKGLPADAQYLSKTGDTSQVVHDSGIILWHGRRYLLAAFTELPPSIGRPRLEDLGRALGELFAAR